MSARAFQSPKRRKVVAPSYKLLMQPPGCGYRLSDEDTLVPRRDLSEEPFQRACISVEKGVLAGKLRVFVSGLSFEDSSHDDI